MATPDILKASSTTSSSLTALNADAFQAELDRWADRAAWITERKRNGWRQFNDLPEPTRKDEKWRFASLPKNVPGGYGLAPAIDEARAAALIDRSAMVDNRSGRLVFANDHCIRHEAIPAKLAEQGVFFESLETALEHHGDIIEPYLMKEGTRLGSEKYFGLHAAFVRSAAVLYVPKFVEIDQPLVAYHWLAGAGAAIFPHTLVIAEDGAKVDLVDIFVSESTEAPGLAVCAADVYAGPGAKVFRKVVQDFNEETTCFQLDNTVAQRDAQVKQVLLNIGARKARFENEVKIEGAGADVKVYSLSVPERNQEFDQRTLQVHAAPNATSDLLFKNALMDKAKTIFSGLIYVEENAQQTDAYQTNRNLLLDPTAEANSLPGLEICANDVKCSHGATTGNLNPEEMFYITSRGIRPRTAKQLMVFGFFEEVIRQIDNEELRDNLRSLIRRKFEKV
ncbi:MAG: Fe-S cluster assembly protein SufD [Opitutales bacterium]